MDRNEHGVLQNMEEPSLAVQEGPRVTRKGCSAQRLPAVVGSRAATLQGDEGEPLAGVELRET